MINHETALGRANRSPDGEPRLMHKSLMGKFGLLGEKLGHSFSPRLHAMLGDYEYRLYEKAPDELEEFLKNGDFDGLNVTIPYKKAVIPYCVRLTERAEKISSVNLLLRQDDGALVGDNTDYFGFSYMLDKAQIDVSGRKVLVLGSGGASRTVRAVLHDRGAGELVVVSRGGEDNYGNIAKHADAGIIVNTTPVGMFPNGETCPVELGIFEKCEAVFDLIYNPLKTALLLDAEDRGMAAIGGLSMLVAQAKAAAEIFGGREIADGVIDEIADRMLREMRNVVLIGMPGCGKTSVGGYLAEITKRQFFDTDDIIERKTGKSVPDIINGEGEEYFRRLEFEALCEAAGKTGCVIATGGGIIKKEENRRVMRRGCVTVFLDRATGELPTLGRPLSQEKGVEKLAAERVPIYERWGDFAVTVNGVQKTAIEIKELLGL